MVRIAFSLFARSKLAQRKNSFQRPCTNKRTLRVAKNEFSPPRFANEHKGIPRDRVIHNRYYQARTRSAGVYFTDTRIRWELIMNIDKPDKYREPASTKDSKLINGELTFNSM